MWCVLWRFSAIDASLRANGVAIYYSGLLLRWFGCCVRGRIEESEGNTSKDYHDAPKRGKPVYSFAKASAEGLDPRDSAIS